jgi:hypothetical protein
MGTQEIADSNPASSTPREARMPGGFQGATPPAARLRPFGSGPGRPYTPLMATSAHTVRLQPDAYELVVREAARRGLQPGELVAELIRADLGGLDEPDLDATLRRAAQLRSTLPPIDGVALARTARADLEHRGA